MHWKGYPNEEDTWEAAKRLAQEAPEAVEEFHKDNPGAPRPLTKVQFADIKFKILPKPLTELDISYPEGICL